MTTAEPRSEWAPTAAAAALRCRARMRGRVRAFFEACDSLEVDTPCLSAAAPTEPQIEPLETRVLDRRAWLHTSPEFPMKRLLAAGIGDCWQLARVFRGGERGRRHQPEFDLLEWYRVGYDHHELMDEVEALLVAVLAPERVVPPAERTTYVEAFRRHAGVDPLEAATGELGAAGERIGLQGVRGLGADDREGWLDHLLTGAVLPALPADRPTFIHDWPAAQAALARVRPDDTRVAERFELFWGDLELANGFHELADAGEQRSRFEAENRRRLARGQPELPIDEHLLAALEAGLPDCAGVALGFDRLVMLGVRADTIDDVVTFPFERA